MSQQKISLSQHLLTIPQAQVKIFDIEWQSAFYEVFHQTKTSRLLHTICMAPIVYSLFVLASYIEFSNASILPSTPAYTAVNGAFVVMLVSAIWYLLMDLTIGLISLPILVAFWFLANVFSFSFGTDGIYAALVMLFTFSFIQTVSHQPEPVPPPHSGKKGFVAYKKWVKSATLAQKVKVILLFPVFTIVELISSPRLLPVQILRLMQKFGFRPELKKLTTERAHRVLKTGDYNAY